MAVYGNILDTVGRTPLVKLEKITGRIDGTLYAKLEMFNPGGSVKDRIAKAMIEAAEEDGSLQPGMTILEPTSGNTGVGLAMVGAAKGYKVIFTMPESMSIERRKLMARYGAEIVLTPKEGGMTGAIEKANELYRKGENFIPQQFQNEANPRVHYFTTGKEIVEDLPAGVNYFVAGVGTGGTVSGAGKRIKERFPYVKIIAVEPEESPVLLGGNPGPHKIQGIGAGFVPENYDPKVVDEIRKVSAEDAIAASRELADLEGILAGISSGAALHIALDVAKKTRNKEKVVVVLPDTGERYLSTDLFGDLHV